MSTELDAWGNSIELGREDIEVYITYNSSLETIPNAQGNEILYNATLFFPSDTKIKYNDIIKYTDPLSNNIESTPEAIRFTTDFAGQLFNIRVVV